MQHIAASELLTARQYRANQVTDEHLHAGPLVVRINTSHNLNHLKRKPLWYWSSRPSMRSAAASASGECALRLNACGLVDALSDLLTILRAYHFRQILADQAFCQRIGYHTGIMDSSHSAPPHAEPHTGSFPSACTRPHQRTTGGDAGLPVLCLDM
jgi:hypothetical protein